ncbi:MAG: hypothetical protein CVT63_06185 [Candidatus Anoxymicrobium japonicum]|uniref:Type II secretion system protein GspG C-terminal domain-containing protein n=1 Tax=Candidatus Anoxymicrobium japonicum TaxID=2013648 RepID=A0A2N3G4Z6_9ACTN|nr:MAG: hypothetical protein CVT63_06185 [Candidatus Anoxymicrobium japonicum]
MNRAKTIIAITCVMSLLLIASAVIITLSGCGGSSTVEQAVEQVPKIKEKASSEVRTLNLQMIDSAIQAYYTENGNWPTDINQLSGSFMRGIPKDPAGGTYCIVMQNGEAKAAVR